MQGGVQGGVQKGVQRGVQRGVQDRQREEGGGCRCAHPGVLSCCALKPANLGRAAGGTAVLCAWGRVSNRQWCLPPTAHWVPNRLPPTGRLTTRRRTCRSGFDVVWPRLQVVLPVLWSVRCEHTGMSFDFTGTRAHRHMSAQAHERCLPRPDGNSRQPHTPLGRFPPAAHPSPSSQHRPSHQPPANRPCTAHLHPIAQPPDHPAPQPTNRLTAQQ